MFSLRCDRPWWNKELKMVANRLDCQTLQWWSFNSTKSFHIATNHLKGFTLLSLHAFESCNLRGVWCCLLYRDEFHAAGFLNKEGGTRKTRRPILRCSIVFNVNEICNTQLQKEIIHNRKKVFHVFPEGLRPITRFLAMHLRQDVVFPFSQVQSWTNKFEW